MNWLIQDISTNWTQKSDKLEFSYGTKGLEEPNHWVKIDIKHSDEDRVSDAAS